MKACLEEPLLLHLNQGEGEIFKSILNRYEINYDPDEIYGCNNLNGKGKKWERPCWMISNDSAVHMSPTTFLIHKADIDGVDELKEFLMENSI